MSVGLFVAGVQKCGTTSLFHYLAAHPGLQPPRVKEIHFFDDESRDWSLGEYGPLEEAFEGEARGRIRFEATPIYIFWPPALARLKAYNPQARLILLFRDPIARAYSHWCMMVRQGAENLSFGSCVREGRARLPADDPGHVFWATKSYVERGFYGAQLSRVLSLFPAEQVLLLAAEDLRHRHRDVLSRIAAFLGIDPFPPLDLILEHRTPRVPHLARPTSADHDHLHGLYAADLPQFARLSGLDISGWAAARPAHE
ncbi:sulfotransferase [Methylorubrum salsuginis]|uniref:Sulfotransferase domain-containing protein n=1 Tax=Methylorubrum salsuginis TaxID=414703 RepID=A0A1I3Y6P2_9HYPH|nr:sulfotransferase [Methylorubrum salsuginis]SFK26951.1 Sulfotransferase domain-containing protein [Methylorubrum salsuginis]